MFKHFFRNSTATENMVRSNFLFFPLSSRPSSFGVVYCRPPPLLEWFTAVLLLFGVVLLFPPFVGGNSSFSWVRLSASASFRWCCRSPFLNEMKCNRKRAEQRMVKLSKVKLIGGSSFFLGWCCLPILLWWCLFPFMDGASRETRSCFPRVYLFHGRVCARLRHRLG